MPKDTDLKTTFESSQTPSSSAAMDVGDRDQATAENTPTLPAYVATVPFHVESDEDCSSDSSDDDEGEDKKTFLEKKLYFEFDDDDPPFRIKKRGGCRVRGQVDSAKVVHAEDLPNEPAAVEVKPDSALQGSGAAKAGERLENLCGMFETQSFGTSEKDSKEQAGQRLALVVGLNRRESLVKKRNRKLKDLLRVPLNNQNGQNGFVARLGFMWRPIFEEKKISIGKRGKRRGKRLETWVETPFERVRSWYRKLAKKDKEKAKLFRSKTESKNIREMVPYREIRETIKNDTTTQKQVKALRTKKGVNKQQIYLGTFDSDMLALREGPGELGNFSHYDKMIAEHQTVFKRSPVVLSSGYRVLEPDRPILAFAVEVDMLVRKTTAQFFPNGVYYPEPNMLMLVEPGKATLSETFTREDEVDYRTPAESKIIIENLLRARNLLPEGHFYFGGQGGIVTTTPERFLMKKLTKDKKAELDELTGSQQRREKEKHFKQFTGYASKREDKLYLWSRQDLEHIRSTSQSHYINLEWAKSVLSTCTVPEEIKAGTDDILKENIEKATLTEMLNSLVSRLFKAYDPLAIAKEIGSPKELEEELEDFIQKFSHVVKNYNSLAPFTFPAEKNREEKREKKKKNHRNKNKGKPKQGKEMINKATWEMLDNTMAPKELVKLIGVLLSDSRVAQQIEMAAKACGEALRECFEKNLCLDFVIYMRENLEQYFEQIMGWNVDEKEQGENDKIHEAILDNTLCGSKNSDNKRDELTQAYIKKNLHAKGRWQLTPLHCAAFTGNIILVRFLKSLGARIDVKAA